MSLLPSFQQETKSADDVQKKTTAADNNVEAAAGAAEQQQEGVAMWLHNPHTKSLNMMKLAMENAAAAAAPDLELTLSVPNKKANNTTLQQQEQDQTSPTSFLLGPISVT